MARVASRRNCMKKVSRALHRKATTKRQRQRVIGKASKACSRKMRIRRAGKNNSRKPRRRQASVKRNAKRVSPTQSPSNSQNFNFWLNVYKTRFAQMDCDDFRQQNETLVEQMNDKIMKGGVSDEEVDAFTTARLDRWTECSPPPQASPVGSPPIAPWSQPSSPTNTPTNNTPINPSPYSYEWYLKEFQDSAKPVDGAQEECSPEALARGLRSESRNLLIGEHNGNTAFYQADPRRDNMIRAYNAVVAECEKNHDMSPAREALERV